MRDALPNASFIGFTGTPLFTDDEITKKVFGNYVSMYDFQRAVDDGAILTDQFPNLRYHGSRRDQVPVIWSKSKPVNR